MKSQCLLATAASVRLSTTPTHSFVDLDGNGTSDVWQLIYGAYGLPASGDADRDGSTNLDEALWRTNPFNPLSRQPLLTLAKPNPNLGFSFPSVKGIRYQVQGTPNLGAVSWSDIDVPLTGTGNSLAGSVTGPFSDRYFLRLNSVASLDGENDGLNAFEEGLLGTSDTTALTDGDPLTDLNEFKLRFLYGIEADPTKEFTVPGVQDGSGDDDRDGVIDREEIISGSSPVDSTSYPPGSPNIDLDQDGLKDPWEIQNFGSTNAQNASGNPDGERLNNGEDQALNLNPNAVQTNGTREDGLSDSAGDNILDLRELEDGTDPFNAASVDLATNFIVLQGFMEHRSAWGAVSDPLAQFSGLTLRAQAIGFENAQPTTGTQTYGLKNEIVGITDQGGGNLSITRSMRFRKGVRYKVELLNPNNVFQLPFVSAKYTWVSGGNADEPNNTYFNYEVVNRQWYNRDPLDTVSPIIAIATDATLSPNPDPLNLHYTIKGAGTGGPDTTVYPNGFLTLNPLPFIQADGANMGKQMKFLPIYEPYDGVGQGLPIDDIPAADLELSNVTATALTAKLLGVTYVLNVSVGNPNLYENTAAGLSILLLSQPLADANVSETLEVNVNRALAGIINANYRCQETAAGSNVFENVRHGIIASLSSLNPAAMDTLTLTFVEATYRTNLSVVETGPDTRRFTGQGYTIDLVNGSNLSSGVDTLYLAIATASTPGGSGGVYAFTETNGTRYCFDFNEFLGGAWNGGVE
jgi:hypothetical protein